MDRPLDNKFPEYATVISNNPITGNDNVLEPEDGQKETGWLFKQQPPYEYMNWIHRVTYQWLEYLDSKVNQFAPREKPTPDLGIVIGTGWLKIGSNYQLVPEFATTPVSAPTTNPRIDLYTLNRQTAGVNIYIGTEAGIPVSPAILPQDLPICRVLMSVDMTEIKNEDITDIRYSFETVSPEVETAIVNSGQTLDLSETNQLSKAILSSAFNINDGVWISNNASDPEHDIDIGVGNVIDSTRTSVISLSSVLTKKIDEVWSEGNNQGGLPSALTLTADTTYAVFVIWKTDGTKDGGYDTSLTAANLLSDASSYTYYRRRGYIITDASANIIGFYQNEDTFFVKDKLSLSSTITNSTSTQLLDLKAPSSNLDLVVRHVFLRSGFVGSGNSYAALFSEFEDDSVTITRSDYVTASDVQESANDQQQYFHATLYINSGPNNRVKIKSKVTNGSSRVEIWSWFDKRL